MIFSRTSFWTLLVFCLVSGSATAQGLDDIPPRAALIDISAPDANGNVVVTGQAGAVTARSTVVVVTLHIGNFVTTTAGSDGSFRAALFAPAGTFVVVKVDITGRMVQQFIAMMQTNVIGGNYPQLAPLPGTILPVPMSTTTGSFAGAAEMGFSGGTAGRPFFSFQGTINSQALAAGDTLHVEGKLRIFRTAGRLPSSVSAEAQITWEQVTEPDGSGVFRTAFFASSVLTPTGFAIERNPQSFDGLDLQISRLTLSGAELAAGEAAANLSWQVPRDLPDGFYRPRIRIDFSNIPTELPLQVPIAATSQINLRPDEIYLPIVRVGQPAPGRLYFTLLSNTIVNGSRGVRAVEDHEHFNVSPRIATPSDTFIVPRVDTASGQPIAYRLEPFVQMAGAGNRRVPTPPAIPFRFPSGSLTVRIAHPDGTAQVIGPVPFAQLRVRTPSDLQGNLLDDDGAQLTDIYELSTMDSRFNVRFTQDGRHVITLDGSIEDIWGNVWRGGGTYEVHVARPLSLDTAVLPGTPFEVGNAFSAGITITPPVPADVQVLLRVAPNSELSRTQERTIGGRANRFGYFQGAGLPLELPGEYRADIVATFRDADGNLWLGSRTWGGVIAPTDTPIIAHGRRGIEKQPNIGAQWFLRSQTGMTKEDGSHLFFPFHSGDVTWLEPEDSSFISLTFQDVRGDLTNLFRNRALDSTRRFQQAFIQAPGTFDQRAAVGEIPLTSSRADKMDPSLDPSKVDLWAYSYAAVERPLVRIREEIAEERGAANYWGFNGPYMSQIGVGRSGDLPNDFKFQYGGIVIRGTAVGEPKYAVYGSLFVLVPRGDPLGGSRTFPPFQGNGGGPSGGPIMTLQGNSIEGFIHLTGVRPGSVLETGDTFSVAGALGPTLPGLVSITVTLPSGRIIRQSGRANKVGYYYRPADDFIVDEPGIYTVDIRVSFDGQTSAGQLTAPFPTGDVLGSTRGRFFVYAVPRGATPLDVNLSRNSLPVSGDLDLTATAPDGTTLRTAHLTTTMPGFLMETRALAVAGNSASYRYSPTVLARDFPNLDTEIPADAVSITLFASGVDANGQPRYAARVIALHGQDIPRPSLPNPVTNFSITSEGGTMRVTEGTSGGITTGYGRVQPDTSAPSPSGLAIFGLRQNEVLVSEAAVPASKALRSGRIYAEIGDGIYTGIAIANPSARAAELTFYFTDALGNDVRQGNLSLPAGGHMARFLDQSPFNGGSTLQGTFTFSSTQPVAIVALRGRTNERGEFLLTTLPVLDLAAASLPGEPIVFPHFADGGGWTTQLLLVNPTDTELRGTLHFLSGAGTEATVILSGQTGTTFDYSVAPRSAKQFQTSGNSDGILSGSVHVRPMSNTSAPGGMVVFTFRNADITVSEAGVPALKSGTAFRLYAESADNSIQTGIAIANSSSSSVTVSLQLTGLSGSAVGGPASITIPAQGQTAVFLNQIPGFESLPNFQGILRLSSQDPIALVGLRGRYNERGDFLITTTSPVPEDVQARGEFFFPHFADGGGYSTQFILFSGARTSGTLRLHSGTGQVIDLGLR